MVKKSRYTFTLVGINLEEIDKQFALSSQNYDFEKSIPHNTTRVEDLETTKPTPEVISFLNESKKKCNCTISLIDINTKEPLKPGKYKCFWDKHDIPDNVQPIGCPIKFVPSRVIKTYYSELSKDQYIISEEITEHRQHELSVRKDDKFVIENHDYYETDGIFCSFNCMMAYIKDNHHNSLYNFSETLALQMYMDLNEETVDEILPAPHWRLLSCFGGHLTIDQLRSSFNKIEYINRGVITQKSIGLLFEDKIRLL